MIRRVTREVKRALFLKERRQGLYPPLKRWASADVLLYPALKGWVWSGRALIPEATALLRAKPTPSGVGAVPLTLSRVVAVLLFALLIFALAVRPAGAADPNVVDMTIDQPNTVTVGDHVRYTVVVEVDQGTNVALAPSALPQEVELIDTPVVSRKPAADGREQITLTFEIAPFVPGQVSIPPLPVRYTAPDGTSGVLQTQSSLILVQSVLDPNNLALRDLKPQAAYGSAPAGWIVPALIGCVVAVIVLIAAAIWRRSVLRQRAAYVPPPRPVAVGPEDLARDALDKAGIAFREDGDFDAYYTALGNAVRNYLTGRYEFPAFALTTRELEAEMLDRGLDRWQVRVAGGLLSQCDSVVYARYRPATERADADLTAAYEIVEMSRPEERMREEVPVA